MLAVAVQLPAAVLTRERSSVAGRALTPSELELEASAGAASASSVQVAGARYLMLTTNDPLSRLDEPGDNRKETLLVP